MALLDHVMSVVCNYRGVSGADLIGPGRTNAIVRPRMEFCFLARKHTALSMPEIGRKINRDHTSVLNAARRIDALIADNSVLRLDLELMSTLIDRADESQPVAQSFIGAALTAHRVLTQRLNPTDITSQELHVLSQFVWNTVFPRPQPEQLEQ